MSHITNMACCGIKEIAEIGYTLPKDVLRETHTASISSGSEPAYFVFSFAEHHKENGKRLADCIIKNNLGEVAQVGPRINRNSGNALYMWIWLIDWAQFHVYMEKENPKAATPPSKIQGLATTPLGTVVGGLYSDVQGNSIQEVYVDEMPF